MIPAIVMKVLGWALPVLLGPIVYLVARELLNLTRRIDDLPPFVKRIAVSVIGVALTAGFTALGLAVPAECVALTQGAESVSEACAAALTGATTVKGLTAGIAAMILHALKKSRPTD